MKVCFKNADEIMAGINNVSHSLGIEVVSDNPSLTINVIKSDKKQVEITLNDNFATICYGDGKARFFRGLATLIGWVKDGVKNKTLSQKPLFNTNGAMFDVSRGVVLRTDTVKTILNSMALMGMNTVMLYTEDTYEIENRPYFGHLRGRYTKQELKELDAYALTLGITIIPCIQVLGHMNNYLRWASASSHKDTSTVLLANCDETYALIEDMLSTISECFTTRKIHIGMDETHDLGRGNYLDKNGYKNQQDIFFEHLNKVKEMVLAHGLEPIMWSDMFFRMAGKNLDNYREFDTRVEFSEEIRKTVPEGVRPVFWDYYRFEKDFYSINIEKHRDFFGIEPIFAGGVWLWSSHCPLYSRSFEFTYPALDACRETNLKDVIATVWLNKGLNNLILSMAGLSWYADYDYCGGYDEVSVKNTLRYACNVDYDTLMLLELPEHPDGKKFSSTVALLFNDPLLGLADKHFDNLPLKKYYVDVTKKLTNNRPTNPLYLPAYLVIEKLSALLQYKADFGLRLKKAYGDKDSVKLAELLSECDVIIDKIKDLSNAHYDAWMKYNKPQGFEQIDIHYGALILRFETTKKRLLSYINGTINNIEELEEDRLRLDGFDNLSDKPLTDEWILWSNPNKFMSPEEIL